MAQEVRQGRPARRWNAIEPQIPALQKLLDDAEEAGDVKHEAATALRKALNRFEDDFAEMVDSLDRMIRLAHVPAGQRAA